MFLTPAFMKKFGKHRTYQVGLVGMILGFAGTGLCGTNVALLVVFNVLKGIGLGAAGGMAFGMVSDTIEYSKLKYGVEAAGMGNAGNEKRKLNHSIQAGLYISKSRRLECQHFCFLLLESSL